MGDAITYTYVSTGSTVAECEQNYRNSLAHNGLIGAGATSITGEATEATGTIAEIRSSVIDGNTHYYIRMEMTNVYLDFSADTVPEAVLLDKGDTITYTYLLEGTEYPTSGILPATGFRYPE